MAEDLPRGCLALHCRHCLLHLSETGKRGRGSEKSNFRKKYVACMKTPAPLSINCKTKECAYEKL